MTVSSVTQRDCEDKRKTCDGRFRSLRVLTTSLLTLAGLGVLVVSGAFSVSWIAYGKAAKADSVTGEHIAASVERDKSIDDKLDSIQASQLRMDSKLDRIAHSGE